MSKLEIEATPRTISGKKVRFLRREGKIPANMYGQGIESKALAVDTKNMKLLAAQAGKTDLISLNIKGAASTKVLIREIQRNAITDEFLHVDFYKVNLTEKIKAEIPLVFIGEAPALKIKNTTLLHVMESIEIEALPDRLPHNLKVDLSVLSNPEQAIHARDIPLGEGVTLVSDPDRMVAKVSEARGAAEEEEKPAEAAGVEGAEDAEKTAETKTEK